MSQRVRVNQCSKTTLTHTHIHTLTHSIFLSTASLARTPQRPIIFPAAQPPLLTQINYPSHLLSPCLHHPPQRPIMFILSYLSAPRSTRYDSPLTHYHTLSHSHTHPPSLCLSRAHTATSDNIYTFLSSLNPPFSRSPNFLIS